MTSTPAGTPPLEEPPPARDGSWWALGLPLPPATAGDGPSVPLRLVRGDTQTPAKPLGRAGSPLLGPALLAPALTLLKHPPEELPSPCSPPGHRLFWARRRISPSPRAEGTLRRPRLVSRPPGPSRGTLAPSHAGLCGSDVARSPSSGFWQAGQPERCRGSPGVRPEGEERAGWQGGWWELPGTHLPPAGS